jgi:3-dehydroquinate synthase
LENDFSMTVIPPAQISAEDYLELMSSDKKAEQGKIRFILLEALGSAVLTGEVPLELLTETLTAGDGLCR